LEIGDIMSLKSKRKTKMLKKISLSCDLKGFWNWLMTDGKELMKKETELVTLHNDSNLFV
jgi:hypothetical protein